MSRPPSVMSISDSSHQISVRPSVILVHLSIISSLLSLSFSVHPPLGLLLSFSHLGRSLLSLKSLAHFQLLLHTSLHHLISLSPTYPYFQVLLHAAFHPLPIVVVFFLRPSLHHPTSCTSSLSIRQSSQSISLSSSHFQLCFQTPFHHPPHCCIFSFILLFMSPSLSLHPFMSPSLTLHHLPLSILFLSTYLYHLPTAVSFSLSISPSVSISTFLGLSVHHLPISSFLSIHLSIISSLLSRSFSVHLPFAISPSLHLFPFLSRLISP